MLFKAKHVKEMTESVSLSFQAPRLFYFTTFLKLSVGLASVGYIFIFHVLLVSL